MQLGTIPVNENKKLVWGLIADFECNRSGKIAFHIFDGKTTLPNISIILESNSISGANHHAVINVI